VLLTVRETIQQLGGLVNSAVQFGPASVANWAKGQVSNVLQNKISSVFKNSQFASVLGQQISGFLGKDQYVLLELLVLLIPLIVSC
jgi:hypothetical protein